MRIDKWEDALADYLAVSQSLTFEWGVNDCSLWAARWVDLVTGSNHALDWQGLYGDEESANALMLERGFVNCEAIADANLSIKHVKKAGRGDLMLHESGALGICDGRRSYFLAPTGLSAVLTITCKKAWTV